jgi:hypothetical protein
MGVVPSLFCLNMKSSAMVFLGYLKEHKVSFNLSI